MNRSTVPRTAVLSNPNPPPKPFPHLQAAKDAIAKCPGIGGAVVDGKFSLPGFERWIQTWDVILIWEIGAERRLRPGVQRSTTATSASGRQI